MSSEAYSIKELKKLYVQVSVNPTRTAQSARTAQKYAETEGFIALTLEANLLEAYALNALGNSSEALHLANKAYVLATEEGTKTSIARVLNIMSIIYFHSHQYDRGIRTIVRAVDAISEIEDYLLIASIYNNLAEIYFASNDFCYANQYYAFALEQAYKNPDTVVIKAIKMNLAITHLKLGNAQEAKKLFKEALTHGTKEDDPLTHAEIEYRLAMMYLIKGDFASAEELLLDSETILLNISNSLYLIDYYYHRAISDVRLSELESIHYLNQALTYAQALDAKQKVCEIMLALSGYHERSGEHELSLSFYKQYHQIEKELESTNLITKLEILKEEHDLTKMNPLDFNFEDTLIHEIEIERMRGHRLHEANQELKKIAHRDELTGIANRRCINDRLSIYMNSNESFALFMIDIDHFKRYNDAFGHLRGDECLVQISKILSQHADHHSDFVGRYGGEEFLYIGRVNTFEDASIRAENLRKLVENNQVKYFVDDEEHQVTICIGGVFVNNSMEHHKEFLLNASDQQLYRAKEEGRNRTRVMHIT